MSKNQKLQVGLIIGGKSVEHDISILSGLQVYHALDKNRYDVTMFYLTKDGRFLTGPSLCEVDTYRKQNFDKTKQIVFYNENNHVFYKGIKGKPTATVIDVMIPAVHGEGAEDGTISGLLELLGIPYTCANVLSSSIAQDKVVTKELLKKVNVPMVPFYKVTKDNYHLVSLDEIITKLGLPVIVKPAKLGSSIGIHVCNTKSELNQHLEESFKYGTRTIIEKVINNLHEYNIAIFKQGSTIQISCIEEVFKKSDILSFVDKYEDLGKLSEASNRIIPAIIPPTLETKIRNIGIKVYQTLDMDGVVRIDFLYDEVSQELYFNEINTIPGSFAFYLFEKGDISFPSLLDRLIKHAFLRKKQTDKLLKTFTSNVLNMKSNKLHK